MSITQIAFKNRINHKMEQLRDRQVASRLNNVLITKT